MTQRVRVGTRGSELALRQTREVVDRLTSIHPDRLFEVITIRTTGDAASEAPLDTLGRGVFVSEIERALVDRRIDVAVHSLKDLPSRMPDGLTIGAVPQRADARDVLVNRWGCGLADLPEGARIGTSSPRRAAQLKAARPDVQAVPMRGNVDTRVRKARGAEYDGAILAAAGVLRMGLDSEVAEYLSAEDFVPPPGQGALAAEVRDDDDEALNLVRTMEHSPSRRAITAERAFLESLGGGCQMPVGAYARVDGETMVLTVFAAAHDGSGTFRSKVRGRASNPHEVALDARLRLVERGVIGLIRAPVS